ncbi:M15 family metallopeptidase [Pseudomonas chlororaphis]|uniref:M15 family metallopeptidase n=1 Tax=Pseudomonas chlororaphis TaxID=587753 RepID=UPI000F562143|nr:M15 family metallopeptidase [Pseudomonas chlororaphis]
MPESTFEHPLFGEIHFRTLNLEWKRGDKIIFLSGFNIDEVEPLIIPQLKSIPGAAQGKLKVHKRAHAQLLKAFILIENYDLLHHVKTCAGTLNLRLRKPTSGVLSKIPSNHAFGIAIDLNEEDPGYGDSVAPLAPIFQSLGFTWGKSFNDPMHFEVNRFLSQEELDTYMG